MVGQDGGPWIGTKVHIIDGSIYNLIGEAKWAKTQRMIKMAAKGCNGITPGLQGVAK